MSSRSDWRTLEEVIGPRSRSFEVLGLAAEVKYRFRIVAVFADDDNRHGDLSKRFRLDPEYDSDRAPRRSPTITQVIILNTTHQACKVVLYKLYRFNILQAASLIKYRWARPGPIGF